MRKCIAFVCVLVCALSLSACNNTEPAHVVTYSFHGEHECFAISNGSIVLSDTENVFDGGKLSVIKTDLFDKIASYTVTFYTLQGEVQRTLMSNSVVDYTGEAIHIEGDLGRISGDGFIIGSTVESIDELREDLWFELKTTALNGEEHVYQIQLTLSE